MDAGTFPFILFLWSNCSHRPALFSLSSPFTVCCQNSQKSIRSSITASSSSLSWLLIAQSIVHWTVCVCVSPCAASCVYIFFYGYGSRILSSVMNIWNRMRRRRRQEQERTRQESKKKRALAAVRNERGHRCRQRRRRRWVGGRNKE